MTNERMGLLVAVVGRDDPYCKGVVGEAELVGPILHAAGGRAYRRILLLVPPDVADRTGQVLVALRERYPAAEVDHVPLGLALAAPAEELAARAVLLAAEYTVGAEPVFFLADERLAYALRPQVGAEALVPAWVPLFAGDREEGAGGMASGAMDDIAREPRIRYGSPEVREVCPGGAALEDDPGALIERALRKAGLRGEDPTFRAALQTAAALAGHAVPVLVEGETGTGKTLLARFIHELSGRERGPFVQVNCAALPEKLVESTLFGHRRGAFTGATEDHAGKFQAADGGTLFLDEVGELPLELQPKLLKVLEDGVVEPVGAVRGVSVNVRIIAATHRDLKAMVAERTFREDLYYRLSFGRVWLPPLRERRGDIRHLAVGALARVNKTLRTPKRLSPAALERLERQEWRGNVRDLENVIGRSVLLARGDVLEADDLVIDEPVRAGDPLDFLPTPSARFSLEGFLSSARKQLILRALDIAGGSQSGAARLLGITPQAVHKFLKGSATD